LWILSSNLESLIAFVCRSFGANNPLFACFL
jgi:hypothetical protein